MSKVSFHVKIFYCAVLLRRLWR